MPRAQEIRSEASLAGIFGFAGSVWRLETNSRAIVEAAQIVFPEHPSDAGAFRMNLSVDPAWTTAPPWGQPYFRGRDHLVLAAYDGGCMLFDLLGRRAVGMFSEAMAADMDYWRRVIFPVAVGVVSAAVGVVPLHCATLVRQGRGLHISGLSGAGKSTLSVALAQRGFALLSDDWTYFSRTPLGVQACGLPVPVKLMPDTTRFFPALSRLRPSVSLNGELAFEIDPSVFAAHRALSCNPERIVFLARKPGATTRWLRLTPAQVEEQFRPALERMPDCLHSARAGQHDIISALAQVEAWSLVCGGTPDEIADEIIRLSDGAVPASADNSAEIPRYFEIPDLMRRFVPAPLAGDLQINGVAVRLQTDMAELLRDCHGYLNRRPDVFCTVLKDDDMHACREAGATDGELSYRIIPGAGCVLRDRRLGRIVAFVTHACAATRGFLSSLLDFA